MTTATKYVYQSGPLAFPCGTQPPSPLPPPTSGTQLAPQMAIAATLVVLLLLVRDT
jgi:hypothetical protein